MANKKLHEGIEEQLKLLKKVKNYMQTNTAKKIIDERCNFMIKFFERFKKETEAEL